MNDERPELIEAIPLSELAEAAGRQPAAARGHRPLYLKPGALADFQAEVQRFIVAMDGAASPAARGQIAIAKTKADEMIYWLNRASE
jgi:hypothetical protein